jgi:hypothetical protein
MTDKPHHHRWTYDGKSCCYRLRCSLPGCFVTTRAYRLKGPMPTLGDAVILRSDGETMEKVSD